MHDIKAIRDNPDRYAAAWASKGLSVSVGDILAIDQRLRAAQTTAQEAQAKRNESSKLIGHAKAKKDEAEAQRLMAEVEGLKGVLARAGEDEAAAAAELRDVLAALPNLPAEDVPPGEDEHGNVERRRWGAARNIEAPKDHVDLGAPLGMDFEAAAKMSGARFVVLKGQMARLERAIGQFMLDVQTNEHGYTEVSPPLLVRDDAMFGTGQLPKFAEDLFRTTDERWLIPTAEVSLTNIVREAITAAEELPLRLTALTPSFRAEAGSAGRDTRGMIRQHQFYKVELVSITAPEDSDAEHERMTQCAEAVLKKLELPYRTMLLCAGDMGFGARKTYDLEVWLPSQATYREISSCSNCGDFQARRMDARFKRAGEKGTNFVHTLNGSGLAVGRTLVAVMENYQGEGGRIAIPAVLQPYMGGLTHIGGEG
ncbi:MAG: serine--tRNA ligase [Caulobacterales bacterium 68-7]|nr:serine--tRNA ligase [Caulobacterales bacterium]OJU08600.1 MAG: serine--tRNA ligase [Caulobacterales bacterium 68-7]